jgi:LacI family transcriptional regulator
MSRSQHIALAFPIGISHLGEIARGIIDASRCRGLRWSFLTLPESLDLSIRQLRDWQGDGAVVAINTAAESAAVRRLGFPVVNISSALARSPIPRVTVDSLQIGQLAAEHLLACGFRHFACYGLRRVAYARARRTGFVQHLRDAGRTCAALDAHPLFHLPAQHWQRQQRELTDWLTALPKPLGLLAVSDYRAQIVLEACHACGLRVPHEVAVLGVNNDALLCDHSDPPLSSVSRNNHAVGQGVVDMLQCLLQGKQPDAHEALIAPDGVVKRASTDVIAVNDPRLAAALRFLQEHASENIGVDAVLHNAHVSRRWLEYAFRDALGTTPYTYLCRLRVERARTQLQESPRAKLCEVAWSCGFSNTKQMNAAFRRLSDLAPRACRRGDSHPA